MKYSNIRNINWIQKKKLLEEEDINLGTSPYTHLKTIIYVELSSILAFILQKTFLTPNFITLIYAILGVSGGILIGSAQSGLVLAGTIIFFFKSAVDWTDGLLARIRKQTSKLGALLDAWAGFVGYYSFIIGLGLYLYNTSNEIHFLYLIILLLFSRVMDVKVFFYIFSILKVIENNLSVFKKKIKDKNKKITSRNIFLYFLKNILDDRARTYDLISLLILLDIFYKEILVLDYIFYAFIIKSMIIYFGNFYLIFFKNYLSKLNLK